jgi:hypothetical protein
MGALLLLASLAAAQFTGQVVYDTDDRVELHQLSDPRLLAIARSAVALFAAKNVDEDGTVRSQHYGRHYRLCRDEPFWDQPSGPDCSGTLIGPDLVLTAGHCVTSRAACARTRFVFGFAMATADQELSRVSPSDVYRCGALLGRLDQPAGADWALVRLDRAVSGRPPAKIWTGAVATGTPLVIAGYPAGLPLKIAAGARVTKASHPAYFEADLDAYAGNSGSGVFHAQTGELLGVMVRGDAPDFVRKGNCKVSNVCRGVRVCGGQDVTRASAIRMPAALRLSGLADVLDRL